MLKMCGIWALIASKTGVDAATEEAKRALNARGPDGFRTCSPAHNVHLCFTRLAINGLNEQAMQPFVFGTKYVICNGEIYNHYDLETRHDFSVSSGSDCEVLPQLFTKFDTLTAVRAIDGVFAFIMYDKSTNVMTVARDPYGVRPLYIAETANGLAFASELKAFSSAVSARHFPPGCIAQYNCASGEQLMMQRYHITPWLKCPLLGDATIARVACRIALEDAVKKRLMSDRPIGCLLSGGLDSSLVAALVAKYMSPGSPPLQTFSIGMPGSTDLHFAALVAKHIGSKHHEILVSEDDFFAAIPEVVRAIESYDITTVRASVGNYLVSKYIATNTDIRCVFNGDGSDECCGGYIYFYNAPSNEEFDAECGRLLDDLHMFDVLRSDRTISSNGLEARTPFLDKQFVATYLSCATELRRPIVDKRVEKQLLREAFDPTFGYETELLPREVLWRTKEAFSDGVSSKTRSWYQIIAEKMEDGVNPKILPEWNTPYTAESTWYRNMFDDCYKWAEKTIPYFWLPRWCGDARDPSARTLKIYPTIPKASPE